MRTPSPIQATRWEFAQQAHGTVDIHHLSGGPTGTPVLRKTTNGAAPQASLIHRFNQLGITILDTFGRLVRPITMIVEYRSLPPIPMWGHVNLHLPGWKPPTYAFANDQEGSGSPSSSSAVRVAHILSWIHGARIIFDSRSPPLGPTPLEQSAQRFPTCPSAPVSQSTSPTEG